jgi:hypothetical protein
MGEAKRRAARANDEKMIEASEVERFCMAQFFGRTGQSGAASPPETRTDHRRYERLYDDFNLDDAEEAGVQRAKASAEFQITDLSSDLVEYTTTLDVIEYVAKATDVRIHGPWVRPILRLVERMLGCKEGTYKAPSVRAAEEAAKAQPAVPEHREGV